MDYIQKCKEIRSKAFDLVINAGKGHLGGSFSCVEMLAAIYYGGIFRYNPKDPKWDGRDKLIFSKGHAINALYVMLADVGYFSPGELGTYAQNGSVLGGHSDPQVPGIEIISGSLGHGLGIGAGMALGHKLNHEDNLVYVIIGDGECQEGAVWEAALFAKQHDLNNLIVFLDRNKLGSEDFTECTASLDDIKVKWQAFGWDTVTIDGHNIDALLGVLKESRERKSAKPFMIIAHTIKGKGMYCLENTAKSHHTLPNLQEIERIRKALRC